MLNRWWLLVILSVGLLPAQVVNPGGNGGGGVGVGALNVVSATVAGPGTSVVIDATSTPALSTLNLTAATIGSAQIECFSGTGATKTGVGVASYVYTAATPIATLTVTLASSVANAYCNVNSNGGAGATGTAATITAGTATTLAPSASPTVTNSGSSSAAIFNFGIPGPNTILNGAGVPSSGTGNNGDFYLNTIAPPCLYGPKSAGAWPGTCVTISTSSTPYVIPSFTGSPQTILAATHSQGPNASVLCFAGSTAAPCDFDNSNPSGAGDIVLRYITNPTRAVIYTPGGAGPPGPAGGVGPAGPINTIGVGGTSQTVRARLNLIAGSNVTITPADNSGTGSTDVTIASTGGGSGGSVFTGSVATATTGIGGTATNPTFSCADQSVKSPIRFEPAALAANVASVTFSSCPAGARFEIRWLQDGTGGRTVTYGGSTVGPCAIIAGANIDTLQPLVVDSTGVVNADGSCSTQAGTTSLVAGTGIAISGTFPNQTVGLATEAADTVVMNATGGTAAPTPVVMPTCTTGANLYNTSTHSWSCVSVGGSSSTFTSSAFSSTPTLTCVANNNNTFKMTLTGNVTSITMASCTAGYAITFYWCQDATGNRTLPPSPTSFTGFFTVGSTLSKCSSQEFGYDGTTFFAKTSGVINQ